MKKIIVSLLTLSGCVMADSKPVAVCDGSNQRSESELKTQIDAAVNALDNNPFETDRYGGNLEIKHEATGFFHIENINGRWMLVTPDGHGYVALGANHVGSYLEKQSRKMGFLKKHNNDMDQGAQALLELIKDLGLNAGGSFEHEPRHAHSLPRIARLYYAPGRDRLGPAGLGPDVFDEGELKKLQAFIIQEVKQYADDPWVIGISASNIPPWDDRRMKRVRAAPLGSPMRNRYREFIMERYPDIASYNRVYDDKLSSFDMLSSEKELKPFPQNKRTREDNDAFLAIIADRLYATVRSAIKTGAPNHLFLGESVIFRTLPDSVLKAIGPHIDAYSAQVIMRSYGAKVIMDSPDQPPHWQIFDEEAYEHVHKLTGKPVIIDDWVASFSLEDTFDTETECGTFFDEQRASEQASQWLVSALKQPYILAVFKCQLIGLHGADRAFGGKSRRTYFKDDGSPYCFRTEITKQAHFKALELAYTYAYGKNNAP